ncbi:hypothetical protein AB1L88_15755 [Tautonia sp. JC769]|uniref:hypothetical protein n=1 Tax=Tautonia sp. JC769 TaxID=3232135 RepID=UPI0034579CA2
MSWADFDEPDWHEFANETIQKIAQYLGRLAVDFAEFPSASLNVKVSAGTYEAPDGQRVSYAGTGSVAMSASETNYLYLDDAGDLQVSTSGWPGAAHLRLAEVETDSGTVTAIYDRREPLRLFGAGAGAYLPLGGGTLTGDVTLGTGVDLVLASSGAGTMVASAANQLLAFHGATPVAQASGADQGALTDSTTGSTANFILANAATIAALTDDSNGDATSTIGVLDAPAALTGSAGGSSDGAIQSIGGSFSQAEIANNFDELRVRVNDLITWAGVAQDAIASLAAGVNTARTDIRTANDNAAKLSRLLGSIRAALVAKGLIKGGA